LWPWFRLEGVGFTILPFKERDSVLRDFAALLSAVKRGVVLARRAWINVKTLAWEYTGALKHHLGRELNVRFGHASVHGWRAGGEAKHEGWA
jgi:hypothetical protein